MPTLPSPPRRTRTGLQARTLLVLACLAPALAACQTAGEVTGSTSYPADLRERHPIKLADAPRSLDLFPNGNGLDARSRQDVADFLAEHRRFGSGPLVLQVPTGTVNPAGIGRAVAEIRRGAGRIAVSSYQPTDPTLASPVRLSFPRLQARVASTCGLWPNDLGVGDLQRADANGPYYNFGCAYQANLAAQIADPNDLVRARRETRPDTAKRSLAIEAIRQSKDPSTVYRQDGAFKINQSVGN